MATVDLLSVKGAVLAVVVGYVLWHYVRLFISDQKAKRLGGLPPKARSRAPFGLDHPVRAILQARKNKLIDFWGSLFLEAGCDKNNNYTVQFNVLQDKILITADPENIKALLTSQFADYGKGEKFHQEWSPFLGDSIFTTDGQRWHDSRQLIRTMFVKDRVSDLDVIEQHMIKLLRLIGDGDGSMVRLDKLFSRFTLDAATHFLFGHSAGSLDDEQARFGVAFDEVQRVHMVTIRAGPLRSFVPQKGFHEGLRTMDEFMDPWINETLALSPAELETKLIKSDTFIHALARSTRDRKMIRDQLMSLLLAGRDTTAATLSWLFLELAKNPRVVQKLHKEIEAVVGAEGQLPTYQNIKDMKYLTYVINETLRLYPAVPFNVRSSLKDTTLPHGAGVDGLDPVGVPKGTMVGYSTILMQRRRDLYPPISEKFPYDPLEWVPERWATWTPKTWQFVPFNGGPRICIGQQFAMVEMGYTVTRILQEFTKIIDYGNQHVYKLDILLTPGDGVKVGFVKGDTMTTGSS